jgi:hypothetical protein
VANTSVKLGAVLFVSAIALTVITTLDRPPDLRSMSPQTHIVDGAPQLIEPARGTTHAVLVVGGAHLVFRNVCNGDECAVPAGLRGLKKNERVEVWRDGNTVWQLKSSGSSHYTFEEALREAEHARSSQYWFNAAMALVGTALFYLGRLFSAP